MTVKYSRIVVLAFIALLAFGAARFVTGGGAGKGGPEGEGRLLELRTVACYGSERPGYRAATDRDQFERLWAALVQPGPAPEIDFSREWVLAASLGRKPTGGFQVTIDEVREERPSIEVVVSEREPGAGEMVTQAISYPGHIVALRRPDGPGRYTLIVRNPAGERLGELNVDF